MVGYLLENGYAVVKGVANEDEVKIAKDLFWDWATKFSPDLERGNPETWSDKNWVSDSKNGICSFINHSEFAWHSRLLPKVKKSFSAIWKTDDLIVSFDAGNAFRPWKRNPTWKTIGGWWHVDQNATNDMHKEGMVCVQGLVTYYDATEETGGLCVFPKSHLNFKEICHRSPAAKLGLTSSKLMFKKSLT
jgi:ectoine hydroxylase-related dioxygenase (phytanoyl-CoA dioxygenase family)